MNEKNYVKYKNVWLHKNSYAYHLHKEGEFEKLDKHMKQLDLNEKQLLERYK